MLDGSQLAAPIDVTFIEPKPKMVVMVHYKSSDDKDTQILRRKSSRAAWQWKRKHNRRDEEQIFEKYMGYRNQFLEMLTEFPSMWDEHYK